MLGVVNVMLLVSALLVAAPPCARWEVQVVPLDGGKQVVPDGWEPIGTSGTGLVVRRCAPSPPAPAKVTPTADQGNRRRAPEAASPTAVRLRLAIAAPRSRPKPRMATRGLFPFRPPGIRAQTMEALSAHIGARIIIRSTVGKFRGTLAAIRPRSVVTRLRDGSRRRWTLSELISIRLDDGP